MFLRFNHDRATQLTIVQPSYDPIIEYYTRGAGVPASGRTRFHPDRKVLGDHSDRRMGPQVQTDQPPSPFDAGRSGVRAADSAGEPEAPRPIEPVAKTDSGGTVQLARWISHSKHKSRSGRVLDRYGRLEASHGIRLEKRASVDDVSPTSRGERSKSYVSRFVL